MNHVITRRTSGVLSVRSRIVILGRSCTGLGRQRERRRRAASSVVVHNWGVKRRVGAYLGEIVDPAVDRRIVRTHIRQKGLELLAEMDETMSALPKSPCRHRHQAQLFSSVVDSEAEKTLASDSISNWWMARG